MSLILEALRKSEAERRRGQAPHLFDVPAPVAAPPPTPARVVWFWAVPVLLALSLALLWWRSVSHDEAPLPASPVATDVATDRAQPRDASPVQVAAPGGGALSNAPQLPMLAVENPAVAAVAPVVPDGPPPPAAGALTQPGTTTAALEPAPSSPPPPAPNVRSPDPAPPRIASAAPQNPVAAPPVPAPPTASFNAVMRLADLPATERNALPPLRMSMHMWAPEPAARFVILDGARVGEGDLVGGAVVDEITPDGAVLTWQGRRLKVPVR